MTEDHARSRLWALLLGLWLPGLGHWYLGRARTAVGLAGASSVGFPGLVAGLVAIGGPPNAAHGLVIVGAWGLRLVAAVHGALLARRVARATLRVRGWWSYAAFIAVVGTLGYAGTTLLRAHVVEAYETPSESGSPNLLVGDHFIVFKLNARDRAAHHGDLVVFPHPQIPSELFIKRVLARGGETIKFSSDGTPSVGREPFSRTQCANQPSNGATCFVERMPGGAAYEVWQKNDALEDQAPQAPLASREIVVPHGHVFVVGDYRGASLDSTDPEFGTIAQSSIVGRSVARWLPLRRSGSLIPVGAAVR